jgi:hypothetical protein
MATGVHLRHSTASLLLMAGADISAVQKILRHTDPRLTTETYGHLEPNYLRQQIDRLSLGGSGSLAANLLLGRGNGSPELAEAPTENQSSQAVGGGRGGRIRTDDILLPNC